MQLIKVNHMRNNLQLVLAKIPDRANYYLMKYEMKRKMFEEKKSVAVSKTCSKISIAFTFEIQLPIRSPFSHVHYYFF